MYSQSFQKSDVSLDRKMSVIRKFIDLAVKAGVYEGESFKRSGEGPEDTYQMARLVLIAWEIAYRNVRNED